ncbi:MAG: ABC transporter ATP-binding protein [Gemmatimonadetes bacterium]|nr:MAG: ABC transporter ATP-binding protein [Gemmatimonadota bacterium]
MIETHDLTKTYKNITAVNHLNLNIPQGVIFGFIGPNGAGKTTTIKMISTLLEPTYGDAIVNGFSVTKEPDAVKSQIGYMPDFFGVYDDMKVWEYLDFFAAAYKIEKQRRIGIIDDVLVLTDLESKREDMVDNLSRGMKQRLCLAKTLVHDPKVLLLDEPASGLDPRARIEMRELLKELKRMGKTILISSHILSELEDFVDTIGIIERGTLLASGNVKSILQQIRANRRFVITVSDQVETAHLLLRDLPEVQHIEREGNTLVVEVHDSPDGDDPDLLKILVLNDIRVIAFHEEETDLEDIFMTITQGVVA